MLALARYQAEIHGPCGGYLPETTDPANEGKYIPGMPHRCHKCTAIGQVSGAYRDSPQPHALMYPIEFRGVAGDGQDRSGTSRGDSG